MDMVDHPFEGSLGYLTDINQGHMLVKVLGLIHMVGSFDRISLQLVGRILGSFDHINFLVHHTVAIHNLEVDAGTMDFLENILERL